MSRGTVYEMTPVLSDDGDDGDDEQDDDDDDSGVSLGHEKDTTRLLQNGMA